MITSMALFVKFLIGIVKRLWNDAYYRSLGVLVAIVILIATLFLWLAAGWPPLEAALYAVATMSMNTPYSGPLTNAAGPGLKLFHMVYTFISVGVFITFALETGKTMLASYDETMKKLAERKAKKAAGQASGS